MPYQYKALDGKPIKRIYVNYGELNMLGLGFLPDGLIGVDMKANKAIVIPSKGKPKTLMRLGRVLKKDNKADDKLIREASASLKALSLMNKSNLKFARTKEEIQRVYNSEDVTSCMSNHSAVQCYATEDIAIAYLEVDNKIIARTVMCMNPNLNVGYTAIYGFELPLETLLEKEGYTKGNLEGCRLLKIETQDRYDAEFKAPFLDGEHNIIIEEDYLIIDSDGEYRANSTQGILETLVCENCSTHITEDTSYYSEHDAQVVCNECYHENHVMVNQIWYHKEDEQLILLESGEYCLVEEAVYVESHEGYFYEDEVIYNDHTERYYLRSDFNL